MFINNRFEINCNQWIDPPYPVYQVRHEICPWISLCKYVGFSPFSQIPVNCYTNELLGMWIVIINYIFKTLIIPLTGGYRVFETMMK